MSESTHDDDATTQDQPKSWDAILSQPIARLAQDATMGDGGWRAVQDISTYSPRRQDVPAQIPAADSMLRLHMPQQAEEDAPANAKLPESLADQLSLTWAARKRPRIEEPEPETVTPSWPASTPAAPSMPAAQQIIAAPTPTAAPRQEAPAPRAEAPLWRRPLDLVTRALGRKEPAPTEARQTAPTPAPEAPAAQPQAQAPQAPAAAAPSQPRATVQRMPEPSSPATTPRADTTPSVTNETATSQPRVIQEPSASLDLTLARQPEARSTDTPLASPSTEETHIESVAPQPRVEATVQRLPDAPSSTPAPRNDAPSVPTTPVRATQTPASQPPAAQDAAPSLPDAPQSERRSILSWLRPRDIARAPVDRPKAPEAMQAPQTPAPPAAQPVQRAVETPRASSNAPAQRPVQASQQPSASLPTAGAPLTHRATPAAPAPSTDDAPRKDTPVVSRLDAGSSAAPASSATPAASPTPAASAPETGDPLPASLQQRMEGLLDVPLREVRVFRGQTSQRVTSQMKADAVTVGNQIHVAPGQGDTSTPQGRALIGHELSHVATHQGAPEPASRMDDASPAAPIAQAMPLPANITPHEDESRAMRLEHAMLRSESAPAQQAARPAPAPPRPLALEHRAPPPQIVVSPGAMASGPRGLHADGWGGQGAAFEAALSGAAAAPWDRVADQAESMATNAASSAIDSGMSAASSAVSSAAGAAASAAGGAMGDEEGMIDRVVDAVMSRIQHEGDVARDRSSAFVPHFGG